MDARGGKALRRAAVVVVTTLLLAATGAAMADAQEHEPGLLPEGDWSEEQMMAAEELVMLTEEQLPTFDVAPDELETLGYVNFGATAPGGYDHWTNPEFLEDDHILDPMHPESLVFQYTDDGGYELVAAMFEMRPGDTMDDIPDDIAWLPGWHAHPDICADENQHFTGFVDENGECAVGQPITIPMMHVWIVGNECDHRFAGIDQGGLICDVQGHPGGGGHGGSSTSSSSSSPSTSSSTTSTTTGPTTSTTRPATSSGPVAAQPNFTG